MKERGITDGLTMNQLAERNAEHVTTIAALEARCAALVAENAGLKYQEPAGYHVIKECGKVGCSVATLEEAEKTRDFWNKKVDYQAVFLLRSTSAGSAGGNAKRPGGSNCQSAGS